MSSPEPKSKWETPPRWLVKWSIKVTYLAGDHHGGCLIAVVLWAVPFSLTFPAILEKLLPFWVLLLGVSGGLFYVLCCPYVSGSFFWVRNWCDIIFVQVWFLGFVTQPILAVWAIWVEMAQ